MGVDRHVPGCARETLAFTVRNVNFSLWISVVLRHAEIWIAQKSDQQVEKYLYTNIRPRDAHHGKEIKIDVKPRGRCRLDDDKARVPMI